MGAADLLRRHLQMEFAHAREHRLTRLGVRPYRERRILLDQPYERCYQPFRVTAPTRLHGHRHDRIGHCRRFQDERGVRCAQGGTGPGGLGADDRDDVPGHRRVDVDMAVCLDPQDPADAFAAPGADVQHRLPFRIVPEYTRR